jgi:glycosyltransferase involved in cell wall biosynthesis
MPMQLATVRDPQSAEYVKALALREKTPARALDLWQAALGLDPESVTLLGHEALALLDLGRRAEVVSRLARALPEHPRHPHLLNLFGVALFELGHARDALRVFEHLARIDPDYPPLKGSISNARGRLDASRPASAEVRDAIERTLANAATRPAPRLACCMIAKNEAEFIVGAIESVKGLADEIIVVDTGSTDDTVALARGAGARVEFFPWIGDFSAARNASIGYATADWILCLDADERLQKASYSAVRAVMEEAGDPHRVVCVRILNYTREGKFMSDGFSGRLFQNVPTMRFFGRVHEEVGGDRTDVSTDYRLDVTFDHFGADPGVMREKSKDARNIELLEARLKEKPDDLLTWFYLGSQHSIGGRSDAAMRAFGRVVDLFERNPAAYGMVIRNLPVPFSYVGYVRGLIESNRAAQALEIGNRGLARFPDNPDLWYHTAFAYIQLHNYGDARRYLEKALEVEPTGYAVIGMRNHSIKAWRAEKLLADLAYEEGESRRAYDLYLKIVERLPEGHEDRVATAARLVELSCEHKDWPNVRPLTEAYLKLRPTEFGVGLQVARLLRDQQGLQACYDLLVGVVDAVPALANEPDIVLAIGQVAEEAGEDQEALRWYERVMELGAATPPFLTGLAQVLIRNGMTDAAAEVLRAVRAQIGRPERG